MSVQEKPRKKMWIGSPIRNCQICHRSLSKQFVDGTVVGKGWVIMCPSCHLAFGRGLGMGRGQKYELDKTTGHFYKIAG